MNPNQVSSRVYSQDTTLWIATTNMPGSGDFDMSEKRETNIHIEKVKEHRTQHWDLDWISRDELVQLMTQNTESSDESEGPGFSEDRSE
jgi:hypothetical protein